MNRASKKTSNYKYVRALIAGRLKQKVATCSSLDQTNINQEVNR